MPRGRLYRPSAAASGPTRSGGGRRHRAERPPSAPSRPCRIVGVEQLRQRPPLLRPRRRLLVHPLRHCWIRGQQQRRPSAGVGELCPSVKGAARKNWNGVLLLVHAIAIFFYRIGANEFAKLEVTGCLDWLI
uniref:Uncharacterized protein n=1 Tax=Oryza glaberrima TaxID=4538 RepID=I1PMQ3_ORYGL